MLYVGNDIVDLEEEGVKGEVPHHKRFMQRVFSMEEQSLIACSSRPNETLWSFWAAKETAYKIIKKISPGVIFSHLFFRVTFLEQDKANLQDLVVNYHGYAVRISICHKRGYIHAVGTLREADSAEAPHAPYSGVQVYPSGSSENYHDFLHKFFNDEEIKSIGAPESAWVRYFFKRDLADKMGFDFSDLSLVRHRMDQKWSQPLVYSEGALLPVDVSLSHHGKWVAWMFAAQTKQGIRDES